MTACTDLFDQLIMIEAACLCDSLSSGIDAAYMHNQSFCGVEKGLVLLFELQIQV
jgi:hypothetical protein